MMTTCVEYGIAAQIQQEILSFSQLKRVQLLQGNFHR